MELFPNLTVQKNTEPNIRLVWATKLPLAAIGLVFPALVLGFNIFIVASIKYQFLYKLENLYDYHWQQ